MCYVPQSIYPVQQPISTVLGNDFYLGMITHFNVEREFGFIQLIEENESEDGPSLDGEPISVFFHASRLRGVRFMTDKPTVEGPCIPLPEKFDQVYLTISQGSKGPRADCVLDHVEYGAAVEIIKQRGILRVRRREGALGYSRLDAKPKFDVRYQGSDLTRIKKEMYIDWHKFNDRSADQKPFGFYLEQQQPDGTWKLYDEPMLKGMYP